MLCMRTPFASFGPFCIIRVAKPLRGVLGKCVRRGGGGGDSEDEFSS